MFYSHWVQRLSSGYKVRCFILIFFNILPTGALHNEANSKNLHLQATHNGKEYILHAGFDAVSLADSGVMYFPDFLLKYSDEGTYSLFGSITHVRIAKDKVWDVDLTLSLMDRHRQERISFKGELINSSLFYPHPHSNANGGT